MPQRSWIGGWRLLAALLGLTIIAGCGTPATGSGATQPAVETATTTPVTTPAVPHPMLTNGSWKLVTFDRTAQPSKPISDTLDLRFIDAGKLGGSSGCNSFWGSYVITGTLITIHEVGSTMMACMPDALMTQEAQYLAALGSVSEFVQTDKTLTLRYSGGELVFTFVPPPPARTLENTSWRFNGFLEHGTVSMIVGAETITVEVRDGKIMGNGGCNQYIAPVTIDGQQVALGSIVSTKIACAALQAEGQFLAALQTVTAWEITNQTLTLQHSTGSLLFVAD